MAQPSGNGNLFVDERPQYPADLHVHPKSYTIYLPTEKLHPLPDSISQSTPTVTGGQMMEEDGEF